jgi:hypothetical protein
MWGKVDSRLKHVQHMSIRLTCTCAGSVPTVPSQIQKSLYYYNTGDDQIPLEDVFTRFTSVDFQHRFYTCAKRRVELALENYTIVRNKYKIFTGVGNKEIIIKKKICLPESCGERGHTGDECEQYDNTK